MRILCSSDLHGYLPKIGSKYDLIILAGDYCRGRGNKKWYDKEFREWLEMIPCPIIAIAGNHDFVLEFDEDFARSLPWIYLLDETIQFDGLSIHGSPWTPIFHEWAFNATPVEQLQKFSLIPAGLDILVTHGPPLKILDKTVNGEEVGSLILHRRIMEVQPKHHVFGHIHESAGSQVHYGVQFANVSYVDERYKPRTRSIAHDRQSWRPYEIEL